MLFVFDECETKQGGGQIMMVPGAQQQMMMQQQQQMVQAVPVQPEMAREQTPAEKIQSLKQLLDVGAITQDEFDLKKNQLLASM